MVRPKSYHRGFGREDAAGARSDYEAAGQLVASNVAKRLGNFNVAFGAQGQPSV